MRLTQAQVHDILARMSIEEQTEIIVRILADDEDCKIINEIKRALKGWGLMPVIQEGSKMSTVEKQLEVLRQELDEFKMAWFEFRDRTISTLDKQERRIERLENTRNRPGIAPRNILQDKQRARKKQRSKKINALI